jgi:hypothetical protein
MILPLVLELVLEDCGTSREEISGMDSMCSTQLEATRIEDGLVVGVSDEYKNIAFQQGGVFRVCNRVPVSLRDVHLVLDFKSGNVAIGKVRRLGALPVVGD